jgi:hypothetical protein
MNTRRGASLIELLMAMTSCVVILTTSTALIHRVMKTQSKTRSFFEIERSSLRLSNSFRSDVHHSQSASASHELGEGIVLRMKFSENETVEYSQRNELIQRTLSKGGEIIQREQFRFTPEINARVVVDESQRSITLSVVGTPALTASTDKRVMQAFATPVAFQATAILGRDRPASSNSGTGATP